MIRKILLAMLFCVAGVGWAAAEVADSAAGGFTVKSTLTIKAAPEEVYRRLIRIGDWWNAEHTYSGDSHNLSIEEKAGGCFCENFPMEAAYSIWKSSSLPPDRRCEWVAAWARCRAWQPAVA